MTLGTVQIRFEVVIGAEGAGGCDIATPSPRWTGSPSNYNQPRRCPRPAVPTPSPSSAILELWLARTGLEATKGQPQLQDHGGSREGRGAQPLRRPRKIGQRFPRRDRT